MSDCSFFQVDMSKLDLEDKEEGSERKATIHELPEGYLGRLQILKSGKARLMIGDVPFAVSLNSKSGFLQVRIQVTQQPPWYCRPP